jgi:hypothetical protein
MLTRLLISFCAIALALAALTPEEKAARKAEAAAKRQRMESCLTLVRSFYAKEETMIKQFVEVHPTNDKGRLTSKFLARMMLKCVDQISEEQIAELQLWKNKPLELDYTKNEDLIMIDWEELRYTEGDTTDPQAKRPVDMTSEELKMSNDVEELSEDMRRENDKENRKSLGKTTLAFIDLETMPASLQAFFVVSASALFGGLGMFFYRSLFVKEESVMDKRKRMLEERQAKKQK